MQLFYLQLTISFGGKFWVDQLIIRQDGLVVDQLIEKSPMTIEGVDDAQQVEYLQGRVFDRHVLWQSHRQKWHYGGIHFRSNSI